MDCHNFTLYMYFEDISSPNTVIVLANLDYYPVGWVDVIM